ncbi:pilus assembly protein [Lysobacteraceae bacterium NML120232]|nr:pilus assembly protein [Xanthomonadaceae bacterium NML08-0793]PJK13768.1 pilus assembly protein [Xanthomonadaceae bacterium NML120232]
MVVLMLLLIITLLGVASMRGTLLQERMAGASYARSVAFNAAETALRFGEARAKTKPVLPATGCNAGVCAQPDPAASPVWEANGFWGSAATTAVSLGSEYSGADAEYIVQFMGKTNACMTVDLRDAEEGAGCPGTERIYRIVARAVSPSGAEVVLQSTYKIQ